MPILPIFQEIPYQDPVLLLGQIAQQKGVIFLDSATHQQTTSHTHRYSYLMFDPFKTITVKNGCLIENNSHISDPFSFLRDSLQTFKIGKIPHLPPFQGGLAGYFAYEIYQYLEKIPLAKTDDMNAPDLALGFYDCVISFDHLLEKSWIVSTGFPEQQADLQAQRARKRLEAMLEFIGQDQILRVPSPSIDNFKIQISSNFNPQTYSSAVINAINYIADGDIFEVNLAQRFQAELPDKLTPFALYQRLREINPAPFAAYLNLDAITLASASPERFVSLIDSAVETRPIKGTKPRGKTALEDQQLAQQLMTSSKDHAENVMIVDLMRNDLSKVCNDDSVQVQALCTLESYATVHHLVSVIVGKLKEDCDAIDLLTATLPGGSITGAPKIRAMEIIAELEPHQRGPYCGSIGFISFAGDMDTSITIRTFVFQNNFVTYHAGGAIVLDSDPESEYQETLHKSAALTRTLMGV